MRCDATRRDAGCLALAFIPSRARFTFQATKIHYNLSRPRLVSYNIRGVPASKNAPSHPVCFSLSLFRSLSYPAAMLCEVNAQYNLGTYKNGISRRVSIARVARECLVVPKIAGDELAHRHAPSSPESFPVRCFRQRVAERVIATHNFAGGSREGLGEIGGGRRETGGNHGGGNRSGG